MALIDKLNSIPLYLISGSVILCVITFCLIMLIRAYKVGIKMGMDKAVLVRTMVSSASFTVLPSVSILLGVIALSGTLGVPLPWLRLSVVGALHYETSVADVAARSIGMSGLNISEMTLQAFTTIGLLMGSGMTLGTVGTILFTKGYLKRLQKPKLEQNSKAVDNGFGDTAMVAMFIGLVSAYIGSYIGTLASKGNAMPLIVLICSGLVMGVFIYFIEKRNKKWLENFSVAGSMLMAMTIAVLLGKLL